MPSNEFVSLECPNCGAQLEPAPDGLSAICKYCGSKLYAPKSKAASPNESDKKEASAPWDHSEKSETVIPWDKSEGNETLADVIVTSESTLGNGLVDVIYNGHTISIMTDGVKETITYDGRVMSKKYNLWTGGTHSFKVKEKNEAANYKVEIRTRGIGMSFYIVVYRNGRVIATDK